VRSPTAESPAELAAPTRPERSDAGLTPGTVFHDLDAPWCPEMVVIPAGRFLMGSPEGEAGSSDDERPQHEVTIAHPFALGRYPVTFGEYDQFCEKTFRPRLGDKGWGRGRRPVIGVSWVDATDYCAWLSMQTGKPYRLPSEAEWEYACRAGTTTAYWWGDRFDATKANAAGKVGRTSEVGSYLANPWGLFDMHGNVWEWCEDLWHDDYNDAPRDGAAWVAGRPSERVRRGGSFEDRPRALRSAVRDPREPDDRGFRGFRVARSLTTLSA
jgi:formylglycine-generating enzyme required for sulfatase activity